MFIIYPDKTSQATSVNDLFDIGIKSIRRLLSKLTVFTAVHTNILKSNLNDKKKSFQGSPLNCIVIFIYFELFVCQLE